MLNFKQITIRNFLSYGNKPFVFNFEKGIIRFSGKNGEGKSVLSDAINFALFGKPYRKIKIGQLINTINRKNLEVAIEFTKDGDEIRIERGAKPDYFRVYKNEEILPVSSSKRGYQEVLEEDILHFNENLANQILFKSMTKNISFMTLAKAEKRNIVENILDIELFSIINKNIKTKIETLDFSCGTLKKDIDNITLLIDQEIQNLEQLKNIKKKIDEESKQKIEDITSEIAELEATNAKYTIALEKIKKNKNLKKIKLALIEDIKSSIKETREHSISIQADIKLAQNKINMFKESCGECPKIKAMMKTDNLELQSESLATLEAEIAVHRAEILTLEKEIRKIDEILANEKFVNGGLDKNQARIRELEKNISVEVTKEILIDESKLKTHQKNKKASEKQYNLLTKQRKHYQILKGLYSDDGIKAFVIRKYLPYINKLLNTYLYKFNSDIIFNFDQEFNEVILTKYKEDFSYFSFSEGQKKRVDLAILFAFINFSMFKNKKASTNLLILDEITSGLDAEGKNLLYSILKEYRDTQNKCIITIDHAADLDIDNFDIAYEVAMEKGFTVVKKVEI